jgi:putative spermidine/putrescine transport system permease protein
MAVDRLHTTVRAHADRWIGRFRALSRQPRLQACYAYLQAAPLTLILLVFLVIPIAVIMMYSVWRFTGFQTLPDFTFANYVQLLTSSTTYSNYFTAIKLTLITWVISVIIAFVASYFLVFDVVEMSTKIVLFLLCVVPFWTSGVIRNIAWIPLLGRNGLINQILVQSGIISEPLEFLLFSEFAVVLAYVHVYTLFMLAPIFNTMARISPELLEAARDNGAKGWQVFWYVVLPLCKPGVAIGTIFVITLTMGDFTAVRLLGGGQAGTVAYGMSNQIAFVQFPVAGANAIMLLIVLLLAVSGIMRLVNVRQQL